MIVQPVHATMLASVIFLVISLVGASTDLKKAFFQRGMVDYNLGLAIVQAANGNVSDALAHFRAANEATDYTVPIFVHDYGLLLNQTGHVDDAVTVLERGIVAQLDVLEHAFVATEVYNKDIAVRA